MADWKMAYDFDLPKSLIAQHPPPKRDGGRLLVVNENSPIYPFTHLPTLLRPKDLLVFNDSRVLPARLFGKKAISGGRVEIFLERLINEWVACVQMRGASTLAIGSTIKTSGGDFTLIKKIDSFYHLQAVNQKGLPTPILPRFVDGGQIPLPPYINRQANALDQTRYQTIFARHDGSVAAPTAGLHFSPNLFNQLKHQRIDHTFITLHVGAGTFLPIRGDIKNHTLHSERYLITTQTAQAIATTKANGGRIIAVGTTVLRALEAAANANDGRIKAVTTETDLFIQPGFKFCVADGLITNFHLPQSSLLLLVCAFGGTEKILITYQRAIAAKMRFYSYGDAMLLIPNSC